METSKLFKVSLLAILGSYPVISCASPNVSRSFTIEIHEVFAQEKNSVGKKLGTIHFEDTNKGLKITPDIQNLLPGQKGFHIHENPSCESNLGPDKKWVAAGAAGGHFDPKKSGHHLGPNGEGHLGDLPTLEVNASGVANQAMIAPRLKIKDIMGHSVMVHQNGDNYSDQPEKLGGGGQRVACGVLKPI